MVPLVNKHVPTIPPMEFPSWLQHELAKREMDQSELARRAKQAGYPIARNTISRIISGDRDAGPDACIAIAYGLGLPREEVFRARGWLLREPEQIVPPGAAPEVVSLINRLLSLPDGVQQTAVAALTTQLETIFKLTQPSSKNPASVRRNKIYAGFRNEKGLVEEVRVNEQPLKHIVTLSPTGFEWGYGGSGPYDLSLSIMTDFLGERPSGRLHDAFYRDVVRKLPREGTWRLMGEALDLWLAKQAGLGPITLAEEESILEEAARLRLLRMERRIEEDQVGEGSETEKEPRHAS